MSLFCVGKGHFCPEMQVTRNFVPPVWTFLKGGRGMKVDSFHSLFTLTFHFLLVFCQSSSIVTIQNETIGVTVLKYGAVIKRFGKTS